MKLLHSILLAFLLAGCSTTAPPPVASPPPVSQTWTNGLRLPDGQMTPGINIYLPAPASVALAKLLTEAGAVLRPGGTAWTLDPVDHNNPKHLAALTQVGRERGHTTPQVRATP